MIIREIQLPQKRFPARIGPQVLEQGIALEKDRAGIPGLISRLESFKGSIPLAAEGMDLGNLIERMFTETRLELIEQGTGFSSTSLGKTRYGKTRQPCPIGLELSRRVQTDLVEYAAKEDKAAKAFVGATESGVQGHIREVIRHRAIQRCVTASQLCPW